MKVLYDAVMDEDDLPVRVGVGVGVLGTRIADARIAEAASTDTNIVAVFGTETVDKGLLRAVDAGRYIVVLIALNLPS